MSDEKDYVDDYFKTNLSPKGTDAIKEKFKSIIKTAKAQTFPGGIKIPINFSDNGSVEYYETLTSIKEDIKNLKTRLVTIQNLQQSVLGSTTIEESKEHLNGLNSIVNSVDMTAKSVYDRLKEMSEANKKLVKKVGFNDDMRARIKQHAYASKMLIETTSEFRGLQIAYRDKYKERVKRHIQITYPEAAPEEVDNICKAIDVRDKGNDPVSTIAKQQYINEEYERAKAQNKEFLELEQNITDLYNLFNEMNNMLIVQNENITNSDELIRKAGKNANVGFRELSTGIKYHKRSKKKMMYIIIAVVTLIFIIIIISMLRLQI